MISSRGHQSSLVATIRFVRQWRTLIAVCAVLAPAVALGLSLALPKHYSASASLLFRDSGLGQQLLGDTPSSRTVDPDREAATNVTLVSLPVVARRTATRFPGLTARDVESKLEVEPEGESDVVVVTATDSAPRRAAALANAFASEFISFRREADRATIREAQRLLQLRLNLLDTRPRSRDKDEARAAEQDRAALREQAQELEVLASLQTGNVELVERAEPPPSPSSPQPLLNTALGLLLGLGTGVGLALVLDRADRRLRDPDEIEEIFDRPLLGSVPASSALASRGVGAGDMPPREREAFQILRANLRYFNVDTEIRSVVVTSAAAGDGKSTVSWNLARAAAAARVKVLLIDADLRRGGLTADILMSGSPGLSNLLSGQSLQDALQRIEVSEGQSAPQDNGRILVDVVVAGPLPPNPTDLFESKRMGEVLSEAEDTYDLVVIDTPPATVVSDAIRLVNLSAGTVVVSRLRHTPLSSLTQLRDSLQNLDARLLGIVVNDDDTRTDAYAYGYDSYGEPNGWRPTAPSRLRRARRWFQRRQGVPSRRGADGPKPEEAGMTPSDSR